MSNKNKKVREELERIYGRKCMYHAGIRDVKPPKTFNKRYKGKSIENQLTLHHLIPVNRYKARGIKGATTIDNGVVLCRFCHDFLEQLPEKEREKVNDELRQYKADFLIGIAEITTEGVQQAEVYEPEPIEEVITIPAYDFTEEEYQEFLKRKRKAELEKPKWEGVER